jgi:hypothetical protein
VNVKKLSKKDFATLFNSGMMEGNKGEILIEESENEENFMEFLKFLYTGSVDYTDNEKYILFLIIANKVNPYLKIVSLQECKRL